MTDQTPQQPEPPQPQPQQTGPLQLPVQTNNSTVKIWVKTVAIIGAALALVCSFLPRINYEVKKSFKEFVDQDTNTGWMYEGPGLYTLLACMAVLTILLVITFNKISKTAEDVSTTLAIIFSAAATITAITTTALTLSEAHGSTAAFVDMDVQGWLYVQLIGVFLMLAATLIWRIRPSFSVQPTAAITDTANTVASAPVDPPPQSNPGA